MIQTASKQETEPTIRLLKMPLEPRVMDRSEVLRELRGVLDRVPTPVLQASLSVYREYAATQLQGA